MRRMSLAFFVLVEGLAIQNWAGAYSESLRLGPSYQDRPGQLAIAVEAPERVWTTAKPDGAFYLLLVDNKKVDSTPMGGPRVTTLKALGKPMAIVIAVDVSGTMKPKVPHQVDPIGEVKSAILDSFLSAFRDHKSVEIALLTFADNTDVLVDFSDSRDKLEKGVKELRAGGNLTRLYPAVQDALRLLSSKGKDYYRRIVVISDGLHEQSSMAPGESDSTRETVLRQVEKERVGIETVGFGRITPVHANSLEVISLRAFGYGGHFHYAKPGSLAGSLAGIARDLLDTRIVTFEHRFQRAVPNADVMVELYLPPGNLLAGGHASVDLGVAPVDKPVTLAIALLSLVIAAVAVYFWVMRRKRKMHPREDSFGNLGLEEATSLSRTEEVSGATDKPHGEIGPGERTVFENWSIRGEPVEAGELVLVGTEGQIHGRRVPVGTVTFRIGQDQDNDLAVADDQYLSRRHARIEQREGRYYLSDLNSLNGTFLNESRLTDEPEVLRRGDVIRVGGMALQVE